MKQQKRNELYFEKYKEFWKGHSVRSFEDNLKSLASFKSIFCEASSILLFKMNDPVSFFRTNMSEYVLKESVNSEFGITIFYIDMEKLNGHYYAGWMPFKRTVLSSPDSSFGSYQNIRVFINANGYGAIATSEFAYYDDDCQHRAENERQERFQKSVDDPALDKILKELDAEPVRPAKDCAKYLSDFFESNDEPFLEIECIEKEGLENETPCTEKESILQNEEMDTFSGEELCEEDDSLSEEGEPISIKLEESKIETGDPRFFNNYKVARTYLACFLDIIINEKLQRTGRFQEIEFIVPKENLYSTKRYKAGAWDVYEDLVHGCGTRDAIRYLFFNPLFYFDREKEDIKEMLGYISDINGDDFSQCGLFNQTGLSLNGFCNFDFLPKEKTDDRIASEYSEICRSEDPLTAFISANLLRAEILTKEEKYISFMRNIKKIYDKDVAAVYKYITEIKEVRAIMNQGFQKGTPKSIVIKWLEITKTKEMLDDAENIAQYIVSEVERKTEKTSQTLLNFIAALTVISAINDLLSLGSQNEHTPLGIIVALFSVVLVVLVGITFFSRLNGKKSKYFIILFVLIVLFIIALSGGLLSGIGRFLRESINYLFY